MLLADNIRHLRLSLREKWLSYYRANRRWLVKMEIWVSRDRVRRPSAEFILGTLTVLEPEFPEMLPLIADLTTDPDRVVAALGLNFSPDRELDAIDATTGQYPYNGAEETPRYLPESQAESTRFSLQMSSPRSRAVAKVDETCEGVKPITPVDSPSLPPSSAPHHG